jgi:uncharacterized glyoxalase superfamily protein PhnB
VRPVEKEKIPVQLVQGRIVTDDVASLAHFYADLVGADVAVNDYYVEVSAGSMSVGFSRCRFTEEHASPSSSRSPCGAGPGEVILDFAADDVDGEYSRIDRLGVEWVLPPTTQPWGNRSMLFRDPEGHLVNVFSRLEVTR